MGGGAWDLAVNGREQGRCAAIIVLSFCPGGLTIGCARHRAKRVGGLERLPSSELAAVGNFLNPTQDPRPS